MQAIRYSSNNSGGSFWLSESDWDALRDAGWEVDAFNVESWPGKPTGAYRFGLSLNDAIDEFNRVTGQWSEAEGCECCGPPHYFYEDDAEPRTLKVQAERVTDDELQLEVHNLVVDFVDSARETEELTAQIIALIQRARPLELEG